MSTYHIDGKCCAWCSPCVWDPLEATSIREKKSYVIRSKLHLFCLFLQMLGNIFNEVSAVAATIVTITIHLSSKSWRKILKTLPQKQTSVGKTPEYLTHPTVWFRIRVRGLGIDIRVRVVCRVIIKLFLSGQGELSRC